MSPSPLRLATRASPLAMAQSRAIAAEIEARFDDIGVELVPLSTQGDRILDQPLADIGGKGLFTAELDAALLSGAVDLAVHSLKDLPTTDDGDLVIAAIPERADPRDVLITRTPPAAPTEPDTSADISRKDGAASDTPSLATIDALPPKARIGTASLRRRAQLLHRRPDLRVEVLRGNVGTRLSKLENEEFDAILLAAAGLARLDMHPPHCVALDPKSFLPAAGQGALAVQCRRDNLALRDRLSALHHAETAERVAAERRFLHALDGSCRTPIGAYATLAGDEITLIGGMWTDRREVCQTMTLKRHEADEIGITLAALIRKSMGEAAPQAQSSDQSPDQSQLQTEPHNPMSGRQD